MNNINGITIDFIASFWLIAPTILAIIGSFVIIGVAGAKELPALMWGGWIGVVASFAAFSFCLYFTSDRYNTGLESIEEHYNVSIHDRDKSNVYARHIFDSNSAKFNEVSIFSDGSFIDGYIMNFDSNKYALVVDDGAESEGNIVEFSEDIDFNEINTVEGELQEVGG